MDDAKDWSKPAKDRLRLAPSLIAPSPQPHDNYKYIDFATQHVLRLCMILKRGQHPIN